MSTLAALKNTILTSLHGRRIGLTNDEFLVGPKDMQVATQIIGSLAGALSTVSTTGTEILNYGVTSLAVATEAATTGSSYGTAEVAGTYALAAPEPGVEKIIYTSSQHSTMMINVQCSTGVTILATSLGSTFGGVAFIAPGQYVRLVGLTTDKWLLGGLSTGTSIATT